MAHLSPDDNALGWFQAACLDRIAVCTQIISPQCGNKICQCLTDFGLSGYLITMFYEIAVYPDQLSSECSEI